MLLAQIVETSQRIAETTKRNAKTELLAALLCQLRPVEIRIAVLYLSGATRQKKTGIGYARLNEAKGEPAVLPTLQLIEVDAMLDGISRVQGTGSDRERFRLLQNLLSRATSEEQRFLTGLLVGE